MKPEPGHPLTLEYVLQFPNSLGALADIAA